MSNKKPDILIREVGPREGFQFFSKTFPTQRKLDLILALEQAGLPEIEVCSFVKQDRLPQMADAEALVAALPQRSRSRYSGLYLNPKGYERMKRCPTLVQKNWIPLAISEMFLQRNSGSDLARQHFSLREWCALFTQHGGKIDGLMISTAFGCAYEGIFSTQRCVEFVTTTMLELRRFGGTDAIECCLADTVGLAHPRQIRQVLGSLKSQFPEMTLSLHLHNTRGLGLANAYAGIEEGVRIFESSVAGLGGCPFTKGAAGSIATEELAYLCERESFSTGIVMDKLLEAKKLAKEIAQEAL